MTVAVDDIRSSISLEPAEDLNQVRLGAWDPAAKCGVGVDSESALVVIMRSCEVSESVRGSNFVFDAATTIEVAGGSGISNVGTLIIDRSAVDQMEADPLVAIIAGIFELSADDSVVLSDVIEVLSELFDSGIARTPSIEVIVGLIGELLVILRSTDPETMISAWHEDPNRSFDFSLESERIEVKTTRASSRVHTFRSTQLPGPDASSTFVASVLLADVEVGTTLEGLTELVLRRLTSRRRRSEFLAKVLQVTNCPVVQIESPQFDVDGSLASIALYRSQDVPTPKSDLGVLFIEWKSLLGEPSEIDAGQTLIQAFQGHWGVG